MVGLSKRHTQAVRNIAAMQSQALDAPQRR
jgi:hypothetical protein